MGRAPREKKSPRRFAWLLMVRMMSIVVSSMSVMFLYVMPVMTSSVVTMPIFDLLVRSASLLSMLAYHDDRRLQNNLNLTRVVRSVLSP
jgi:hypothetical protein